MAMRFLIVLEQRMHFCVDRSLSFWQNWLRLRAGGGGDRQGNASKLLSASLQSSIDSIWFASCHDIGILNRRENIDMLGTLLPWTHVTKTDTSNNFIWRMPLLLVDGSWFSWEFLISWRWKTLMLSMAWKDEGSGMAPLSSSVTFQRLLLRHKID